MYIVTESKPYKRKYLIKIKTTKKEEEFIISEDLMVEFRLVKNKELEKETFLKFKEAFKRDELYQKVLHYALYKQRCTYDIEQYLDKKQIFNNNQEYYLDKLRKTGILDDQSYVQNYVNEAFNYKRYGPQKIMYDLSKKQIDKSLYQPELDKIKEKDQINNIEILFNKKLKSIKNKSIKVAIQNIKQYITNKGYHYALVNNVVDNLRYEIEKNLDEDQSLNKDYLIAKKKYSKDKTKEYQNILAYLLRKGYTYNKIKKRMEANYEAD